MRNFIESVTKLNQPTLFVGTNEECLPESDLILTTFDKASLSGRFVYEGTVDFSQTTFVQEEHGLRISNPASFNIAHVYDTHCPDAFIESTFVRTLREYSPDPGSHLVFVTGKLAKSGLDRVLNALVFEEITYEVRVMDIAVAAWLTNQDIIDGIGDLTGVDVLIIPGKVTGDELELENALGIRVLRGPSCYSELPEFFEQSGVEIETVGNVRPRIIVLGMNGINFAKELATTYEVPLVDAIQLLQDGSKSGDETATLAMGYVERGEDIPHYLMAELIRSRMIESDVRTGFVMVGYPNTVRDIDWLVDMKIRPDAVVFVHNQNELSNELVSYYRNTPGFIEVESESPDALATLFTQIESMLQTCVMSSENT